MEKNAKSVAKRLLLTDNTPDGGGIRTALGRFVELVNADDTIGACVLYLPVKESLRGTTLEKILGTTLCQKLRNNEPIQIKRGCDLRLETFRTFHPYTKADAVFAVYADQGMMDKVDGSRALKLIVCIPHAPDAVAGWERTWRPETDNDSQPPPDDVVPNKVVEAALESMTVMVNTRTAHLKALDKETIRDAFRILRAHDQSEDPANIRAWCIRRGWTAGAADEAVKLATKAFALSRKPSHVSVHLAENIYERWLEETTR